MKRLRAGRVRAADPRPDSAQAAPTESTPFTVEPDAVASESFTSAWVAAGSAALLALVANAQYPQATPLGCAYILLCVLLAGGLLWKYLAPAGRLRIGAVGAACLAACLSRSPWTGVFALAILFAAAGAWGTPAIRPAMRGLLVASTLLAMLALLDATGLCWQELSRLAWNGSRGLARLSGVSRQFGPGQWGLGWIAPAWCVWAAQLNFARSHSLFQPRLLLSLMLGTALALATEQLLFALALAALVAALGEWRAVGAGPADRHRSAGVLGLLAAAPLMLVIYCWGMPAPPAPRTLTIVDGGLKTLELPSATKITNPDNALFGGLLALMPAYGWQCRVVPPTFAPADLSNSGVLCFINPQAYLSPAQKAAVESYVRDGGSLLVLGDHTDIGGIRGPLNQLLGFTGIRFNYDSAIPTDTDWKWKDALRAGLHPALWAQHNNAIGISVGASLSCDSKARVLVVGDRCFSDRGNPLFGVSHLGNEAYDPGEQLGGLPLAAEERVGRGVVQVWGDTSGFQDSVLTRTHPTIARIFENLRLRRPNSLPRALPIFGFLAAVALAAWLLERRPDCLFAGLAAMLAVFALTANATYALTPLHCASAAYLDVSHAPLYPQSGPDAGEYRLSETFLRQRNILLDTADFPADFSTQFKAAGKPSGNWWVITAPTRAYSEAEAARLHAWVQQGGRLLLVAGEPHRAALRAVLQSFGLDIAVSPYGAAHNARLMPADWRAQLFGAARIAVPDSRPTELSSYDAEIQFQESYPVLAATSQPLVSCWGRPLVVEQACGAGKVILIGDSRFCTDKNLGRQNINAVNIKFLLKCLQQ